MDGYTMNSDDEFDEDALRLAALKSLKQTKYVNRHNLIPIVPINVVSPISDSNIKVEPISPTREQKFLEEKDKKESSTEEETEEEVEVEADSLLDNEDDEDLERLMDKLEAEIEGKVAPKIANKVKIKKKRKKKKSAEDMEVELVGVRIGKTKPVGPVIDVRESVTPDPTLRDNKSRSASRKRSPRRSWSRSPRPRRWSRSISRTRSPGLRRRRTRSRSWSPYNSRSPVHRYRSRSRYNSPRRWSKSPRRLVRSPLKTRLSPYRPRSRSPKTLRRFSPRLRTPPPKSRTPLRRSRSPPPRSRSPRRWSRSPPPLRSRTPRPRTKSPPPRTRSPHLLSRSPPPRPKSPVRSPKRARSRSPRPPLRNNRLSPRNKRRNSLSPTRIKPNGLNNRRTQSPRRPGGKDRRSPYRRKVSPRRNNERKRDENKVEESNKAEELKEPAGPVDPVLEARRRKFECVPNHTADKKISLKAVKDTIEPLNDDAVQINTDALWDDDEDSDSQEGRFKGGHQVNDRIKPISFRGLREGQPLKLPTNLDDFGSRLENDRFRRDRLGRRRHDDRPRRNNRKPDHSPVAKKENTKLMVKAKVTKQKVDDFEEFVSAFEKELEKEPAHIILEPALSPPTRQPPPRITVKKDLFAPSSIIKSDRSPKFKGSVSQNATETEDSSDLRSLLARKRQERIGAPLQPIKSRLIQSAFLSLIPSLEQREKSNEARVILKMKMDEKNDAVTPFAGRFQRDAAPRPKRRVRKVEDLVSRKNISQNDETEDIEDSAGVIVTQKPRGFRLKRSVTIASQVNIDD